MRLVQPPQNSPKKSEGTKEQISDNPALALFGYSGRKGREYTATSVRWSALFWVLFVVAIPPVYITWLNNTNTKQQAKALEAANRFRMSNQTPTGTMITIGMAVTQEYQRVMTLTPQSTPTPVVTFTAFPTITPTEAPTEAPTSTPVSRWEAEEIQPVYWWINYNPPPPGNYRGPNPPGEVIETYAKISYYYPPLAYVNPRAWINCDKLENGKLECEHMTNGEEVRYNVGLAAACPSEWPQGSILEINGQRWMCKDTGGDIKKVSDNLYWVDLLYPYLPLDGVYWGEILPVKVYLSGV